MPEEKPPVIAEIVRVADDDARRAVAEGNRLSWNEATRAHNSHKADQAKFFREGGNKLFDEEREVLGDISGLSVVHLQCNSGQDTLSLKALGAGKVHGVDISDEAIEFAKQLSADSGIEATFERSDVYDWLTAAAKKDERWDIVYCSYGAIIWLSDLETWARGIASILKPGGRFVTVEFHPVEMMFDENYEHKLSYSTHGRAIKWADGIGDYVGASGPTITPSGWVDGVQDFQNPHPSYEFAWGLSEVIQPLIDAGLVLENFREYDHTGGARPFKMMVQVEGERKWMLPRGVPRIAMMYSIVARKPA